MSWRLIDPDETGGPDKVAGGGCMVLGAVLVVGAAALLITVRSGCSGAPHGCGLVLIGAPVIMLVGLACVAAGYWLYPKRPRNQRDRPPNEH